MYKEKWKPKRYSAYLEKVEKEEVCNGVLNNLSTIFDEPMKEFVQRMHSAAKDIRGKLNDMGKSLNEAAKDIRTYLNKDYACVSDLERRIQNLDDDSD